MSGKPSIEADVRLRQEASQSRLVARGVERPNRIVFRNQDLFLAQKIEVLVTAGTRIDDGGKVPGKIVGVTVIFQRQGKVDLQSDLGGPDEFTVSPGLTVNRDFTAGSNCIQERLAVARKSCDGSYARKQGNAFPLVDGDFVSSSFFSRRYPAKQVLSGGVSIGNLATVVDELFRLRAVYAPSPHH